MDGFSTQGRDQIAPSALPRPNGRRLRRLCLVWALLCGTAGLMYGPAGYALPVYEFYSIDFSPPKDPFEANPPVTGEMLADDHGGFTEVAEAAGLTHQAVEPIVHNQFGGVAVGDFFGNGLPDLFFTRHDNTDIFYKNMGDGTFEDVTTEVFGPDLIEANTNGALMADLNNDGHLDLYVTTSHDKRHYMYINDGEGHLEEQAIERNAALEQPLYNDGMSVTAGDYNGDHYLDLYVSDWRRRLEHHDRAMRNRLLRNRGESQPGYFDDVTKEAGLHTENNHQGFGGRFVDMNRNGRMDLLAANDYKKTQYFRNNGDGTFTEITAEMGVGTGHNEMGSTVADYNNDGYLDWFVTSIGDRTGNRLYRNELHRGIEGIGFSDQTDLGVRQGYWGWGTSFIDYDNDGWRDIVLTNGFRKRGARYNDRPMLFYQNEGPERGFAFSEIGDQIGVNDTGEGRALVVADFFGNGFLDILVVNYVDQPVLYRNNGGPNQWLRIKTVGEVSHPQGIGAFITVEPRLDEPVTMVHDVNLGATFLGHNETTAHFGLGKLEGTVDRVHIRWPSGIEQEFTDVAPNQVLTIHETQGIIRARLPGSTGPLASAEGE